ncbi:MULTISPECIES: hypothetical protein [unclassified Mesorhizobium]|nr:MULTISPECIES: hypothetical protein [unclassified Mesorhizobium]
MNYVKAFNVTPQLKAPIEQLLPRVVVGAERAMERQIIPAFTT